MKTTEQRKENSAGFLELPKSFISKSFHYKQIMREDNVAIYRKYKEDDKENHYEVFKIIEAPAYEIAGVKIPAKENVPGNELWGSLGFSCTSLERAKVRFQELLDKKSKPE